MKLFLTILLLLNFSFTKAQNYYPFPPDSAEWSIDQQTQGQFGIWHSPVLYYMHGDTTISGTSYHKIIISSDSFPVPASPQYYLREQNKVIYYRNNNDTLERLLYNFNIGFNDTIRVCNSNCMPDSFVVTAMDSISISSGFRKRITLNSLGGQGGVYEMQWVEGIGDIINGLIYPDVPWVDWWFQLLCFHEHDSLIWTYQGTCWVLGMNDVEWATDYHNCFPNPFSDYASINYFLAKPGDVSVELLDASGKLLNKILLYGENPGKHSVYFDTGGLAPGIYLYRLKKDNAVNIGKMIKLR